MILIFLTYILTPVDGSCDYQDPGCGSLTPDIFLILLPYQNFFHGDQRWLPAWALKWKWRDLYHVDDTRHHWGEIKTSCQLDIFCRDKQGRVSLLGKQNLAVLASQFCPLSSSPSAAANSAIKLYRRNRPGASPGFSSQVFKEGSVGC